MTMNGFFTDNQIKQSAYDRYYNAMAKSDFVQGSKLKALIQQESMDDASADSLANLYQQVMGKTRDYDYDKITKKLTKGAPEVINGEYSKPNEYVEEKPQKKKHTFVPESTDTETNNEFRYEEMFNDENYMKYMDDINYHKMNKGINMEQVYQDKIQKYLTKNKEFRNLVFNQKRKKSKSDIDDKATDLARAFVKRKREVRAPDEASPNLRPMKGVKREEIERKMSTADLSDTGTKSVNEKVKSYFDKVVDNYEQANRNKFLKHLEGNFKSAVDNKKGEGYFEKHAPKMSGSQSKKNMASYKSELKKWMSEVLS